MYLSSWSYLLTIIFWLIHAALFLKDGAISLVSHKTHERVGFFYTENIHAYNFILLSIRELFQ